MANLKCDDFKLVCGRRKAKRVFKSDFLKESHNEKCNVSEQYLLSNINDISTNVSFLGYFEEAKKSLVKAQVDSKLEELCKLVCFGLGSFSSCLAARHQLAFILQVQRFLKIEEVQFYDPILNECEESILEKFGWKRLQQNCEGKYRIERPTLLYFPHCPKQLTNNFLWENWDISLLSKVIIICNSFSTLVNNTPERLLEQDAKYILRIAQHAQEIALENNYFLQEAFNDTSIHFFLKEDFSDVDENFWSKGDSPIYNDTELITRDLENKNFM